MLKLYLLLKGAALTDSEAWLACDWNLLETRAAARRPADLENIVWFV